MEAHNSVTVSVTSKGGSAEGKVEYLLKGSGNEKTVAVTGANGFIGSHLVKLLLFKRYRVRGTVQSLDPAGVDHLKLLPGATESLSLFKGELMEEGCFDEVFEGCDCVFHLASPTLKDQNDMKMPEVHMVEQAVCGTRNVLRSCKKAGVKTVVLTSSMCAATPKPGLPEVLNEAHWSDPKFLMNKGSFYAASKTRAERIAIEFLATMPTESSFRLVRICPTFTVGPMLQPTANSSMERFAAVCAGTHHDQIPNRSISLVDVRDVAAHHVAAYENEVFEGRFFSLTEAWPWTLVYEALKFYCPQMKCPEPLPQGTKLRKVRKYNTTRMKALGVNERSFMQVLVEAVKEVQGKTLDIDGSVRCLPVDSSEQYLVYGGYYDIGFGDGRFFMIEVVCQFSAQQRVTNIVKLSWVLEVGSKPTIVEILEDTPVTFKAGKLIWTEKNISLSFERVKREHDDSIFSVVGSIGGTLVSGRSFVSCVPYQAFFGTYASNDGKSVSLTFEEYSNIITDSDGKKVTSFCYNPIERKFSYKVDAVDSAEIYLNVAAGHGLKLTFVRIAQTSGSTETYFKFKSFKTMQGLQVGAAQLAAFAGYYPLDVNGAFVSILPVDQGEPGVKPIFGVGVSIDGKYSTQYGSFQFENNILKLGDVTGFVPYLALNLRRTYVSAAYSEVTVVEQSDTISAVLFTNKLSFIPPVPLAAFGTSILTGTGVNKTKNTLQLIPTDSGPLRLVYKVDGATIFDRTSYVYNSVEQVAYVQSGGVGTLPFTYTVFNFTYAANSGVTCAVTSQNGQFEAVVYAVTP